MRFAGRRMLEPVCPACFKVPVRLGCILKRIALMDVYADLAGSYGIEKLCGHRRKIGRLCRVRHQARAGNVKRSELGQDAEVHRWHRAGGIAEARQQSVGPETFQG